MCSKFCCAHWQNSVGKNFGFHATINKILDWLLYNLIVYYPIKKRQSFFPKCTLILHWCLQRTSQPRTQAHFTRYISEMSLGTRLKNFTALSQSKFINFYICYIFKSILTHTNKNLIYSRLKFCPRLFSSPVKTISNTWRYSSHVRALTWDIHAQEKSTSLFIKKVKRLNNVIIVLKSLNLNPISNTLIYFWPNCTRKFFRIKLTKLKIIINCCTSSFTEQNHLQSCLFILFKY